jgi:hypothetical protein
VQALLEVISGGQTGVDRGALDAALEAGTPCGGWCPQGRLAEDGPIPGRYPLRELAGGDYPQRTRRNVQDSDGTLVLHFGPVSGGTQYTITCCRELGRPVCLIDGSEVPPEAASSVAQAFVDSHGIRRLNVAGPRASHCGQAYDYSRSVLRRLIEGVGRG